MLNQLEIKVRFMNKRKRIEMKNTESILYY